MSAKNHAEKSPAHHGKNEKGGRKTALYFLLAAGVLALCWYYVTACAGLQIDSKHNPQCALYKTVAWVVSSQAHKVVFGLVLALPLVLGLKLKRWAVAYYRLVAVLALIAVAGTAWDLSSPVDCVVSYVDRLLDVDFFDRS
jgi:hypothetical protein